MLVKSIGLRHGKIYVGGDHKELHFLNFRETKDWFFEVMQAKKFLKEIESILKYYFTLMFVISKLKHSFLVEKQKSRIFPSLAEQIFWSYAFFLYTAKRCMWIENGVKHFASFRATEFANFVWSCAICFLQNEWSRVLCWFCTELRNFATFKWSYTFF